jgi:hypothetical protein
MALELLLSLLLPFAGITVVRALPCLRIVFFIARFAEARRTYAGMKSAAPAILQLFGVMGLFVMAFALLGFLLCDSHEGPLATFPLACYNLLYALMIPPMIREVIMPYFRTGVSNGGMKVWTMAFTVVMLLFWTKQILALITRTLKDYKTDHSKRRQGQREARLRECFGVVWRQLSRRDVDREGQPVLSWEEVMWLHVQLGGDSKELTGALLAFEQATVEESVGGESGGADGRQQMAESRQQEEHRQEVLESRHEEEEEEEESGVSRISQETEGRQQAAESREQTADSRPWEEERVTPVILREADFVSVAVDLGQRCACCVCLCMCVFVYGCLCVRWCVYPATFFLISRP